MYNWNPYLVPVEVVKSRPNFNNTSFDTRKDDIWFNNIIHYYVTSDLRNEWGFKMGYKCKTKDVSNLLIGIDFKVSEIATSPDYKIARGAPDEKMCLM